MKVRAAVKTQIRVIIALVLREVHTLYGHTLLGYLWAIIQTAFSIAVFWWLRIIMHARAPHGMTTLSFLVCGFLIWNVFEQILLKSLKAIEGNRALLTFPQVMPLDVILARAVVIVGTQFLSMACILGLGYFLGLAVYIDDISLLLGGIFLTVAYGIGCGSILSALAVYLPALHNIVPMAMRLFFFASGVFFSVTMFSHRVGEWLLLNPVMQLIEMTRTSMSNSYHSPYYDIEYLLGIALLLLTVGLMLERYIRRRLQA